MEIPTAKYGKTTKNTEKIHVRMRVQIQRIEHLKGIYGT
jgi:hypothetical protein